MRPSDLESILINWPELSNAEAVWWWREENAERRLIHGQFITDFIFIPEGHVLYNRNVMTTAATLDDVQNYLLEWPEAAEDEGYEPAEKSGDGSQENNLEEKQEARPDLAQYTKPKPARTVRKSGLRPSLRSAPSSPASSRDSDGADKAGSDSPNRTLTTLEKRTKAQKIRRVLKRQGKPPPNDPKLVYATDEVDFLKLWHKAFGVEFEAKDLAESFNAHFHDRDPRAPLGLGERFKRELAKIKKTSGVRAGLLVKPKNKSKYKIALKDWKKTSQARLRTTKKPPSKKRKRQSSSEDENGNKEKKRSGKATPRKAPATTAPRIVLRLNLGPTAKAKGKADSHDKDADTDTDESSAS